MTISIAGCGWFGLPFAKRLVTEGFQVRGSTTSPEKISLLSAGNIEPFLLTVSSLERIAIDPSFFNCDTLIIAIPPKTRSKPVEEYISIISQLIEQVKLHVIPNVIFISSTSVYGDVNAHVNEQTEPEPETDSGKLLLQCELMFKSERSFATTVVRFGGLIGPGRDAGNFFAGKKNVPNGLAPVNLIHLDDCIGICLEIIKRKMHGVTVNAVSPRHPTRMEFYVRASRRLGVEVPEFVEELVGWKIVNCLNCDFYDFCDLMIDF